jgi:hypothetical protein
MIVGKLVLNDLIAKWLAKVERLQDRIYVARVSKLNTKKTTRQNCCMKQKSTESQKSYID